jgi:hypothetical protein
MDISPKRSDPLWDPVRFLFSEYKGFFIRDKAAGGVKLTTYLHILPILRMSGAAPLLLLVVCVMWTETTLIFVPLPV